MDEVVRWALLSDYATWVLVVVAAVSLAANYLMYKKLGAPESSQSLEQQLQALNQHLDQLAASKTGETLAIQEIKQELQNISTRMFGLQNVVHKSLVAQQGAPTGIRGLR